MIANAILYSGERNRFKSLKASSRFQDSNKIVVLEPFETEVSI